MHRQEMEGRQQEVRKAISRLEDYIDAKADDDDLAHASAKKDIMFLLTETENMTRLLIRYWDKELRAILDDLPDEDEWEEWKGIQKKE